MNLELIRTVARMREFVAEARRSVGCVPTMGALHAGHGALIDRARSECGTVVTTIFVNLIQFDRQDDYERYARTLDADLAYCEARRVDAIFAPWDRSDSPGCALALKQNGNVVYERGYGMTDLEHDIPITPATVLHAASLPSSSQPCL